MLLKATVMLAFARNLLLIKKYRTFVFSKNFTLIIIRPRLCTRKYTKSLHEGIDTFDDMDQNSGYL